MRSARLVRFGFVLLLALAALPSVFFAQSPEDVLLKADRDFNQATKDKKLEGWMPFMADDVVLLRGKPVFGKDAVRATLKSDWDDPEYSLTWEPKRAEMFQSGKMGNTSGRWTYVGKNAKGEKVRLHGDYLTVWQKQSDGALKVIYDGGTTDPDGK